MVFERLGAKTVNAEQIKAVEYSLNEAVVFRLLRFIKISEFSIFTSVLTIAFSEKNCIIEVEENRL